MLKYFLILVLITSSFSSIDDSLTVIKHNEILIGQKLSESKLEIESIQSYYKELKYRQQSLSSNSSQFSELKLKISAKSSELSKLNTSIQNFDFNSSLLQKHYSIRKSILSLRNNPFNSDSIKKFIQTNIKNSLQKIHSQISVNQEQIKNLRLQASDSTLLLSEHYWDQASLKQIKQNIKLRDEQLSFLKQQRLQIHNYLSEIDGTKKSITLRDKGKSIWHRVLSIWNLEITRSEGQPVTLGKILLALLVSFIGIKIAKRFSIIVSKVARRRFRVDQGIADAAQKLLFYTFTVLFVLYALYLVRFPLTAFTFAGGAIAIGVGFGSQTLMNNFISGLILLIERPVKTGDFIEVEDIIGTVDSIGLRSTLVRTPANVHLVIPNSSFLEKKVTNWTLSDRIIRLEMSVGVAYGSDVKKVKEILEGITKGVLHVQAYPHPVVIFSEFGDSALTFELIFWIHLEQLIQRRVILSEIRYKIENAFDKAGIVISFPQRDIHFVNEKPLEIKIKKER